jgi:drug/metabolite transporter (DMT)-like permease
MIEHVHDHLTGELSQNARTDTVFVVTAILLSLVILGINSIFAAEAEETTEVVMYLFIVFQVFVIAAVIFGLLKGKRMRTILLRGLMEMYRDQNVDKYYDEAMLKSYAARYNTFIAVVVLLGVVSVAVPLIVRYT